LRNRSELRDFAGKERPEAPNSCVRAAARSCSFVPFKWHSVQDGTINAATDWRDGASTAGRRGIQHGFKAADRKMFFRTGSGCSRLSKSRCLISASLAQRPAVPHRRRALETGRPACFLRRCRSAGRTGGGSRRSGSGCRRPSQPMRTPSGRGSVCSGEYAHDG
jgi:hypothetical protein